MTKRWQLTWLYRDNENNTQRGKLEADDYGWLNEQAMKLKSEGCVNILASKKRSMDYDSSSLPDTDWSWEGAMAGADGYNGRAYVANVAQDPQGQLWVFTKAGRYRVHREEFARKLISSEHLAGLPLQLEPSS